MLISLLYEQFSLTYSTVDLTTSDLDSVALKMDFDSPDYADSSKVGVSKTDSGIDLDTEMADGNNSTLQQQIPHFYYPLGKPNSSSDDIVLLERDVYILLLD